MKRMLEIASLLSLVPVFATHARNETDAHLMQIEIAEFSTVRSKNSSPACPARENRANVARSSLGVNVKFHLTWEIFTRERIYIYIYNIHAESDAEYLLRALA